MNKPLNISSSTHPIALSCYFIQALLGFGFIINITSVKAIVELLTYTGASVWALLFLTAGIGALLSAIISPRLKQDPSPARRTELISCLILGLCIGAYYVSLIVSLGWGGAITTQLLCAAFILGDFGRAWQLKHELPLIRRAKRLDQQSSQPLLADPDE